MSNNKVCKPSKKMMWRGQKGNKFRVWTIKNTYGKTVTTQSKSRAEDIYNASLRVYNKRNK